MDEPTDKAETDSAEGAHPPEQTLVVIGNGMMSWKLCQKLVECGANDVLNIVVFGEESHPAYDRVHLTEFLSGRTAESLLLSPAEWYVKNGITLHLNEPVIEIDREDCVVRSEHHEVLYDRLVFATGSHPFVPPIEGADPDRPGIFVYRTLDHVAEILAYSNLLAVNAANEDGPPARAAVIGGGLLGLEAAKAVYDLGLRVHVVEFAPGLMNRQLDARAQGLLKERIENLDVQVHISKQTTRIEEGPPTAYAPDQPTHLLHFSHGSPLEVDMVIISAGIRPRSDLAAAAGLELARNGGIVVDDHLITSDPRIFAVGECAVHRGMTYGLALPGYKMVDVLVDNLVGGIAAFEGTDQSARLKLMGVAVASLGQFNEKDVPGGSAELYVGKGEQGEQVYRKLVMRDGRIVGCIAVGEWANLDRIRDAIEQPRTVSIWDRIFPEIDLGRFRGTGTVFKKSESPHIAQWPADALVCGCLHVTRGTLGQAQLNGCSTVEELCARTGAGTMCGSCKPLLAELLGASRESVPPSSVRNPPVSRRSLAMGARASSASLSARDPVPLSRRKPIAPPPPPPPYEPVAFARHTPTPAVPVMRATLPTPIVAAPSSPDAPIEDGPLSRRGSSLPQLAPRRGSLRPSAVRVEVVPPLPREPEGAEIEPSAHAGAAAPASAQVSFRPPDRISFAKSDPLDDEDPGPISVRVPNTTPRPPSTSPRPLSSSQRPPSTSKRLAVGHVQVREREASQSHEPILPPLPESANKSDSIPPPPDSSPPSLRDFLPPSARGVVSLQHRDTGSRLMREAASLNREIEGEARESAKSRDLARSRDALRGRDVLRGRDLDRTPARTGEAAPPGLMRGLPERPPARTGEALVPDSPNPPAQYDSVPPPSRRRDSMPPLRPISVPPVRGSAAPGRLSAPPGRISNAPRSGHPAERGYRILVGTSLAAFLAVLVVTVGTIVVPFAAPSSTHGTHLAVLWSTNGGKQVTGYAATALALASLLLSLWKRWKPFLYSEMWPFRIIHAILGVLTVVALVFHTGLHLGSHGNMNQILMYDLLSLTLIGAVSGVITALRHWFKSQMTFMSQHLLWFRAHLILFLPLPVLLALHILAAYYY